MSSILAPPQRVGWNEPVETIELVWIAIALVFLIVGLRRRKSATPPGGSPGV